MIALRLAVTRDSTGEVRRPISPHECDAALGAKHFPQGDSAIDARTTRHAGYDISQKRRKRIEECFGWLKDIALLRKLKHRGLFKGAWIFHLRGSGLQTGANAKADSDSRRGLIGPWCLCGPNKRPVEQQENEF